MPFICTIASGSTGNSAVVSDGRTHILVDAGVSCRRIYQGLKELDIAPEELSGILITHEHIDHIRGLELFCGKANVPVYMTGGASGCILEKMPALSDRAVRVRAGGAFAVGDIEVEAFNTPHDTPESVGYTFLADGYKLAYMTDIGCVTEEMINAARGAEYLCVESNHDLMMLLAGRYPEYLKRRIMGRRGHLSNDDCCDFITEAVGWGAREILLCHLSRENNLPQIAYDSALGAVRDAGATKGDGVNVYVAPPNEMSHVCRFGCDTYYQFALRG